MDHQAHEVVQGKTFAVPERVPFRLTANMVDALGATGYEGKCYLSRLESFPVY